MRCKFSIFFILGEILSVSFYSHVFSVLSYLDFISIKINIFQNDGYFKYNKKKSVDNLISCISSIKI